MASLGRRFARVCRFSAVAVVMVSRRSPSTLNQTHRSATIRHGQRSAHNCNCCEHWDFETGNYHPPDLRNSRSSSPVGRANHDRARSPANHLLQGPVHQGRSPGSVGGTARHRLRSDILPIAPPAETSLAPVPIVEQDVEPQLGPQQTEPTWIINRIFEKWFKKCGQRSVIWLAKRQEPPLKPVSSQQHSRFQANPGKQTQFKIRASQIKTNQARQIKIKSKQLPYLAAGVRA